MNEREHIKMREDPQPPVRGLKILNMRKLIFKEKLKVPPGGFRDGFELESSYKQSCRDVKV
ncbi:MAG TPA: hypothetical protein VHO46_00975 [Bacteroidales bacterium]|nr:hypothetical protein [Bacteroidales bacterium]